MPDRRPFQFDEERPDDLAYEEGPSLLRKTWKVVFGLSLFAWVWLLAAYPNVWAYATGGALLVLIGFATARFVLQVTHFGKALAWSPLLGACWFGLIWLLMFFTR